MAGRKRRAAAVDASDLDQDAQTASERTPVPRRSPRETTDETTPVQNAVANKPSAKRIRTLQPQLVTTPSRVPKGALARIESQHDIEALSPILPARIKAPLTQAANRSLASIDDSVNVDVNSIGGLGMAMFGNADEAMTSDSSTDDSLEQLVDAQRLRTKSSAAPRKIRTKDAALQKLIRQRRFARMWGRLPAAQVSARRFTVLTRRNLVERLAAGRIPHATRIGDPRIAHTVVASSALTDADGGLGARALRRLAVDWMDAGPPDLAQPVPALTKSVRIDKEPTENKPFDAATLSLPQVMGLTVSQICAPFLADPPAQISESIDVDAVKQSIHSNNPSHASEFAASRLRLPSSELLDSIILNASELYSQKDASHMLTRMQSEALLALGILTQEFIRNKFENASGRWLTKEQCDLAPNIDDLCPNYKETPHLPKIDLTKLKLRSNSRKPRSES